MDISSCTQTEEQSDNDREKMLHGDAVTSELRDYERGEDERDRTSNVQIIESVNSTHVLHIPCQFISMRVAYDV
jgi:hypothetical protein